MPCRCRLFALTSAYSTNYDKRLRVVGSQESMIVSQQLPWHIEQQAHGMSIVAIRSDFQPPSASTTQPSSGPPISIKPSEYLPTDISQSAQVIMVDRMSIPRAPAFKALELLLGKDYTRNVDLAKRADQVVADDRKASVHWNCPLQWNDCAGAS